MASESTPPRRALLLLVTKVVGCCAVWFTSSILIIYLNKYYLSVRDLRFPLTVNLCTNTGTVLLALAVRLCSNEPALEEPQPGSRRLSFAIGVITALDVGASNAGLTMLPVSFHTVIRGSIPGFVLLFALVLGMEKPQCVTIGSILCVCVGIAFATVGEMAFSLPGFLLVGGACIASALRWVLIQKLVQLPGDAAASSATPIGTILRVSPSAIATTVPLVLYFELERLVDAPFARADADERLVRELGVYLGLVCVLVFVLMYSEYLLVQLTSSLTLSVAGILKELICILGAIALFHDTFSPLNVLGFALCAVGIVAYNAHKMRALRGPERLAPHHASPVVGVTRGHGAETDAGAQREYEESLEQLLTDPPTATTSAPNSAPNSPKRAARRSGSGAAGGKMALIELRRSAWDSGSRAPPPGTSDRTHDQADRT